MEVTTQESFHEVTIVNQDGFVRALRVPVVQELVRHGSQDVPSMFLRPPSDTLDTVISCLQEDFPFISMAKLHAYETEEREKELVKLADGLKEWGMVLISDHGIPSKLLSNVKQVIKSFFGLSFKEKKRCIGTYATVDNMGYGRNFVKSDDKALDWIDRLTMKVAPKDSTNGLNVWPQKPANFREVIETYAEETRKVGDEILQSIAEALSLEKNAFIKYFEPKTREINVRINYYPPCPKPKSTMGLSPHADGTVLTLLIQFDTSGGLQVMHKHKKIWVSVPWPTDAILVNVGDFLEIMSNGRVESSWHRAVTQAELERYSLALFFNPSLSTEIEPIKNNESRHYEYKKVVVDDYLQHLYKISPTLSKEAIRELFESYVEEAKQVCDELLEALAEALSLDKISFTKYFDPKTREINIRVNYYPPCPNPNLTLSFNPHTDASVLSLLIQFGSSGTLQVMHNNKWETVPWPNDALLINAGDLLEIMSNGRVQSLWHRVVAQADVERYSVALFFNPPLSTRIEPVKGDNLRHHEYKEIVVGDYLKRVYKISPTTSKEAIKFAMLSLN